MWRGDIEASCDPESMNCNSVIFTSKSFSARLALLTNQKTLGISIELESIEFWSILVFISSALMKPSGWERLQELKSTLVATKQHSLE